MGERAQLLSATRQRIVEAAIELFTERGRSLTTLRDVGRRADVAPGTLRNHFPSRDLLEAAVVERLTEEAWLPPLTIFDGARSMDERINRLLDETGMFLDRAARLYRMWLREPMLDGPWTEAGARYGAHWEQLMKRALGPLARNEPSMTVLRAVSQPAFFDALRARARSTAQAAELAAELILPWLNARPTQRARAPTRSARY
jgi:AcrR family transcriptional regulator